ncbi:hypothetical protein C2E23DRAFT_731229 [Lenzites betulinus]|nr:hypothetical protein C2E23DRAFT_731229 [Lenzites betulinus]
MSLRAPRICLDVVGRTAGGSSALSRTWSSGLVTRHRCYASAAGSIRQKAKPAAGATTEEDIQNFETMHRLVERKEVDISSTPLDLLDLSVPSWRSLKEGATILDHLRAVIQRQRNWVFNARALYRMAKARSIPGVKPKSPWSWQLLSVQSTKPTAWLAPFRQAALEVYKRVNEAVAARDEKAIKLMSIGAQQAAYTRLIRKQDPRYINVWKFHGERTPCRVVSIRAFEAYYGIQPPRIGSRLAVQALVRFDTLQSIETYNKKTGARLGETEPKPVVEYLVFQKRMWFDSPWVIRDRLYEGLESRFMAP